MNITYSQYKTKAERLALAQDTVVSVEARAGTALRSLAGRVWITQEGDARDYMVPAGKRYTAARGGRVVVNAVDGAAQVAVSWVRDAAGTLARSRVSLDYDSIAELNRTARRTRAREIARLVKRGWAWLARAFRSALGAAAMRQWIVAAPSDRGYS